MPFTTSHPAAVLLLWKLKPRWFSLSGLMAGAMSPDLLYFLMMTTVPRGVSHSWTGLLLFCVPAGVAFAFAFHWLFKYHFIVNLPRPFDRWLSGLAVSRWAVTGWRQWLVLLSSVLIGALSHFLWDSFTHAEGEIARRLPFLTEYTTILGVEMRVTRILQHLSTLGGALTILAFAIWGSLLPPPVDGVERRSGREKLRFWAGCFTVPVLFVLAALWFYGRIYSPDVMRVGTTAGLASWAGVFWAVVGYCFIRRLASHRSVNADKAP